MKKINISAIKNFPWTIRIKLLVINTFIFVFSIGAMIFLATYFFKKDTTIRTEETSMNIADSVGSSVKIEFQSIIEKANLILTNSVIEKSQSQSKDKLKFQNLFFRNDPNFLMLGEFFREGEKLIPEFSEYNTEALKEMELSEFDIDKAVQMHSRVIVESFTGKELVHNISLGIKIPSFAISFLRNKNSADRIVIAILKTNKISIENKSGVTQTFLVNDRGDVILHSDEKVVLNEKNLFSIPIVQSMIQSKFENGQISYLDPDNKERYIGSFRKIGFAGLGIITSIPEKVAYAEVYNIQRRNIIIMLITMGLSFLVIYNFANTLSIPLLKLVAASKEIESGNFTVPIRPTTTDEVGLLTTSFVEMGKGLEEREKIKNILGNMIDPVVVNEAMKDLQALKRGSEKQITAFFSDVASFSTISEKLTSFQLANLLNEYLSAMTIILKKHEGVLDKYIGDAIVGIFNAPLDVTDHSLAAARASVEMIQKLGELRNEWEKNGSYIEEAHHMKIRIGLNTGTAKVGFMGTDALASYTMMGDTVNLAARLEAAAKDYGVDILVSESIHEKIKEEMFVQFLDLVRVKGKNEPVKIYALIDKKANVSKKLFTAASDYEKAFQNYLNRNWQEAIQQFSEYTEKHKLNKKAADLLLERCHYYANNPPKEDWDGVFTREHK
ncbi:MAG TPA: adenylate/guanylate cyclase domain-containing protein [Leptospiraceae bacterium]|nr:adenylate/guanylate cyclase domain-containing protein [Leptospiraceae bacterium]HRG75973.1 adenylate/guanylate cyclase domain-containing protein [Leptospiraceae bacterium]